MSARNGRAGSARKQGAGGTNGQGPKKPAAEPQEEDRPLQGTPANRLKARKTVWLWPGRLELASVAMVQGEKGAGKSTWLRRICAHVTAGVPITGSRAKGKALGSILWFAGEENLVARVQPGLAAAGADLGRCHLFDDECDEEGVLRLPADCKRLANSIRREKAVMVVIDPVFAFLDGTADIEGGSTSARKFMRELRVVAHDTGALIVLMRNLTKDTTRGALACGRGSGELGNAARSVLHLHSLPHMPGTYGLAVASNNNGEHVPTVTYRIGNRKGTGVIEVLGETELTADELAAGEDGDLERTALEQAMALLPSLLPSGKIDSNVIKLKAERSMIGTRVLQLAAQRMGVRYKREGARENTIVYWLPPLKGWKP